MLMYDERRRVNSYPERGEKRKVRAKCQKGRKLTCPEGLALVGKKVVCRTSRNANYSREFPI